MWGFSILAHTSPNMAHEALRNAFSAVYQYATAFVLGTLARYRKLKWQGKLVVVALALFNITLVTVLIVIGPDAIFQVRKVYGGLQ